MSRRKKGMGMYRIGIAAVTALIGGCTVSGPDPLRAIGLPNPASVYCIEQGGSLDIEQRAGGDVNICVQSDGTRIEEWKLYKRDHG